MTTRRIRGQQRDVVALSANTAWRCRTRAGGPRAERRSLDEVESPRAGPGHPGWLVSPRGGGSPYSGRGRAPAREMGNDQSRPPGGRIEVVRAGLLPVSLRQQLVRPRAVDEDRFHRNATGAQRARTSRG